jgi:hypothetical protein
MKKRSIILGSIIALVILSMWVPGAEAYERYNDGCQNQNCHGAFTGSTSPKGSVFPSDDKHTMHRNASYMNTECNLCHTSGDGRDPFIGSSDGTGNNPGLGCTGCHAEFGLRAHHAVNSITQCAGCHPNDPTPTPENTLPVYYGTADTNADMPCNPDPQANINENWTIGDSEGIDNDGDNLYDGNDPDCAVAVCGDGTVDPSEDCDEGNANGTTTCGCQTDCTYTLADTACENGEFCTVGDTCNGTGTCIGGGARDCDDGLFCTGDEICDSVAGCISTGDPCPEGMTCNEDKDTCDQSVKGLPWLMLLLD